MRTREKTSGVQQRRLGLEKGTGASRRGKGTTGRAIKGNELGESGFLAKSRHTESAAPIKVSRAADQRGNAEGTSHQQSN